MRKYPILTKAPVTKANGSGWNNSTAARLRYSPSVSFNFVSRPASVSRSAASSSRPLREANSRKRWIADFYRSCTATPGIGAPSQVRPYRPNRKRSSAAPFSSCKVLPLR